MTTLRLGLVLACCWISAAVPCGAADRSKEVQSPPPPPWITRLFAGLEQAPANRLVIKDISQVSGLTPPAFKVVAELKYRDPDGKEKTGRAKLYLPSSVRDGKTRLPLYHAAGY
jgi:hypothetical protein